MIGQFDETESAFSKDIFPLFNTKTGQYRQFPLGKLSGNGAFGVISGLTQYAGDLFVATGFNQFSVANDYSIKVPT